MSGKIHRARDVVIEAGVSWRASEDASGLCQNKMVAERSEGRLLSKVRMVVSCLLGATVLVPDGASAFAAFSLPSIAKHVPPIRACLQRAGRLLVGMGGSTSRYRISIKLNKAT